MAEYTLENTCPLKAEIERRMGDKWLPKPTSEEVEERGKLECGEQWEPSPPLPDPHSSILAQIAGHGSAWQAIRWRNIWDQLERERWTKMKPVWQRTIADLRKELRAGKMVCMQRSDAGLAKPLDRHRFDGTWWEKSCETGELAGLELWVGQVILELPSTGDPKEDKIREVEAWLERHRGSEAFHSFDKAQMQPIVIQVVACSRPAFEEGWRRHGLKHKEARVSGPKSKTKSVPPT